MYWCRELVEARFGAFCRAVKFVATFSWMGVDWRTLGCLCIGFEVRRLDLTGMNEGCVWIGSVNERLLVAKTADGALEGVEDTLVGEAGAGAGFGPTTPGIVFGSMDVG